MEYSYFCKACKQSKPIDNSNIFLLIGGQQNLAGLINYSFQKICYCRNDGCNGSKSYVKTDSTTLYLISMITFLTISDLPFGR